MKKRALLTGFGGFVAGSIAWHCPPEWDLHGTSRKADLPAPAGIQVHPLELLDTADLERLFKRIRPDVVFHTAAMADIDRCQQNQEAAKAVNAGVTAQLSTLCRDQGARLIFTSTDSIFDGIQGMYRESDAPSPVNYYAETKVQAEETVLSTVLDSVVARLSLVLGFSVLGEGNSFLAKMIHTLESGGEASFPANEIRTPVDVITLGRAFWELAEHSFTGILHLSGCSRLNRYEMAQRIAARLDLPQGKIIAVDSNAIPGRAPRPNDASLDNSLARRVLKTPMLSLEEALELTLQIRREQENGKS
ncbi:MAG TPA: SDR family oxidoreductase [Candidatus Hydrogenedentes bacterium]|jgi:dTDP-4-dehydrorhamnose reductase|nr:MAG: dTDP-4-dehydrorhamnose reductase [Candidatus Hydrogenedentes bacterium ADurb.Bin170]HNZ49815.1 SDR family oxidoreductase [Candidatus Hydrogenedentota bacterium]HOD94368.1 SDR family oxidoreductase [Candidatus Hydrogenedentota bacterium]HOH42815.1 SDR family oxidoreductase [Candidatus Hydrogenedentota bacterium]HOM46964.1 SDR family oxidoreductase [Candidatus Hydrogenedentota bacterium]